MTQNAAALACCPECGRSRADRSLPRPVSLLHWRWSVPVLAAMLCALLFGTWLFTNRSTYQMGLGSPTPALIEPAVTPDDVEKIAKGEQAFGDDTLIGLILEHTPGPTVKSGPGGDSIRIGWTGPGTRLSITDSRGWLCSWWWRTRELQYTNAMERTGFRPAGASGELDSRPIIVGQSVTPPPPPPRWEWFRGTLTHRPPPEETEGIKTTSRFVLSGLAIPVSLIIVTWWMRGLLRIAYERMMHRRSRRVLWLITVLLIGPALLLGVINLAHHERHERVRPPMNITNSMSVQVQARPDYVVLPWVREELEALAAVPGGDQRLAAEILELAPRAHRGEAVYLAVGTSATVEMDSASATSINETIPLLWLQRSRFVRRSESGPPDFVSAAENAGWGVDEGRLWWFSAPDDPLEHSTSVLADLGWLAVVIVGLWAVWLAGGLVCRGVHRMIMRKRRRVLRCAGCGHQLVPADELVAGGAKFRWRPRGPAASSRPERE